eukprot:175661-Chlamydomonas_euryale.AAC.1
MAPAPAAFRGWRLLTGLPTPPAPKRFMACMLADLWQHARQPACPPSRSGSVLTERGASALPRQPAPPR